jgi:hypothetical protein
MSRIFSTYALNSIDAVPVNVVADGDRVRVIEIVTGRCLLSVRQPEPGEAGSGKCPFRYLAPQRLSARKARPFCA